jgi:GT2 family glycosyltransferase
MREPSLALIIPTKDRPEPLARLLASIQRQSAPPAQVIVVDGGAVPVRSVCEAFPGLAVRYLAVRPPSLTRQKNLGIGMLDPAVTLVGFLDDDLVLEDGALERMLAFWHSASPRLGGAGFTLVPPDPGRALWIKELFAIDSRQCGRMLPSGYNASLRPRDLPYETEWLRGGASVWRREVVDRFRFDEWFTGYSYLEDVDYSLRVGREYRLMVAPGARVRHESRPLGYSAQFRLGVWQVVNRCYLIRKHRELSPWWCAWSLLGQTLLNATGGLLRWGLGGPVRAAGNCVGWGGVAARRSRRRHGSEPC